MQIVSPPNYLKYPLIRMVCSDQLYSVRTNRQIASQFLHLPWICVASGVPGGHGRMIDIGIGR